MTIWTPKNYEVSRINKAVNEYDERLYFERNQDTGDWCIYLKTISSEPDLPILGFQHIPKPEEALKALYKADTLRHGERILDDMNKKNSEIGKERERKASDASGETAEAMEWGFRKMGSHPVTRVFIPKEI